MLECPYYPTCTCHEVAALPTFFSLSCRDEWYWKNFLHAVTCLDILGLREVIQHQKWRLLDKNNYCGQIVGVQSAIRVASIDQSCFPNCLTDCWRINPCFTSTTMEVESAVSAWRHIFFLVAWRLNSLIVRFNLAFNWFSRHFHWYLNILCMFLCTVHHKERSACAHCHLLANWSSPTTFNTLKNDSS